MTGVFSVKLEWFVFVPCFGIVFLLICCSFLLTLDVSCLEFPCLVQIYDLTKFIIFPFQIYQSMMPILLINDPLI